MHRGCKAAGAGDVTRWVEPARYPPPTKARQAVKAVTATTTALNEEGKMQNLRPVILIDVLS